MDETTSTSTPSGWSSPDSFLTRLFSGDPVIILLSFVVTLSLPVLLHFYFYTTGPTTSRKVTGPPTFVLLGPSGSGKTSLLTLLQQRLVNEHAKKIGGHVDDERRGRESDGDDEQESTHARLASPTRMSQTSNTVGLALPSTVILGSNKYRSENDPALKSQGTTKYQLIDTPGHGKLRSESAMSFLNHPGLQGVIYMVDSTALDTMDTSLARDTVAYLHDVLLSLQRRRKSGKKIKDIPVLIAANKQDLFTALPAGAIKGKLQSELEKMRTSRRKGISAVDSTEEGDEEFDVLGGGGEESFSFKILEDEYGIVVDVVGGAARGDEAGKGVQRWEEWIGSCL